MPGVGSDVATAAGLVAAGVGLGGVMVFLGFMGAKSQREPPAAARKLGGSRRRRQRYESSSDDDPVERVDRRSASKDRSPSKKFVGGQTMSPEDGMDLITCAGWSMVQARELAEQRKAAAARRTPMEVLAELQKGNVRFWTGQGNRPEKSAFERRALISMQFPNTAILGCSDSRVPLEIVFDQGLGDLFVIRVAGNFLDTATSGSLQYAVKHLKVKVLVVMGHEGCGAVKAAQLPLDAINREPESLSTLLKGMRQGLDAADLDTIQDPKAQDREAVTTNVRAQVEGLVRDEGIMKEVRNGELLMVGAFYEISSGIVDFFHEVSGQEEEDLDNLAPIQRAPSRGVLTRLKSVDCLRPPTPAHGRPPTPKA